MLENFKVIEIVKANAPLSIIIEDHRIRFTRPVAEIIDFPGYIHLLMDDNSKMIAVQVCRANENNAIKFSKSKDEQKTAIIFQNMVIIPLIREMMTEWEKNEKYEIFGKYSKDDKAVIFDLKAGKPYSKFERKND